MDPNTTLCELIDAAHEGDYETLAERAEALCEWLKRGGFYPNIIGIQRHWGDIPAEYLPTA